MKILFLVKNCNKNMLSCLRMQRINVTRVILIEAYYIFLTHLSLSTLTVHMESNGCNVSIYSFVIVRVYLPKARLCRSDRSRKIIRRNRRYSASTCVLECKLQLLTALRFSLFRLPHMPTLSFF